MNILLWTLQILLALHTIMGAVWKFTNSEEMVPSLSALPHWIWLTLIGIELICSLCLILPSVNKSLGKLAPIAAGVIAGEMLLFCALQLASGTGESYQMIYWIVVAVICSFIAFGRLKLKPIGD